MENKYYQPELSELHVGLECVYTTLNNGFIDQGGFLNPTHHTADDLFVGDLESWDLMHLIDLFQGDANEQVRVRHLEKEDIESLNYVKNDRSTWVGWNDYVCQDLLPGSYAYYINASIHVPRMGDMYKIYVHRYWGLGGRNLEEDLEEGESKKVYEGNIKNKSELKKLLKMLNIINYGKEILHP